jgi:hypothetical protein
MKVKNYMMTNSYDEKIMNWNRQDFTELVNQMAEDEISDMNDWLSRMGYEIDPECRDYAEAVVFEYIKQWLIQQINESITCGTQELFEIYSAI